MIADKTQATTMAKQAKNSGADKTVTVTLVKSPISHNPTNRATVRALGLRRIGDSVEIDDTPALRGMVLQLQSGIGRLGQSAAALAEQAREAQRGVTRQREETDQVAAAMAAGLKPIACIGETLPEREAGKTLEVCFRQMDAFAEVLLKNPGYGVIAYEPVWAIGTGKVATPEQAQEVHAALRKRLAALNPELAEKTRILYGGSVKADNAKELLGCPDIDGALVGGAALDAAGFAKIAQAAG